MYPRRGATAQPSRHQAQTQHQSAHPATRQRPASATPAYDAASDPMTLADEVTTFSQLYNKAHTETVTPQSAAATRVERWNNTAKKDWRSLPYTERKAMGMTSMKEDFWSTIGKINAIGDSIADIGIGTAKLIAEIPEVAPHMPLVNSPKEYLHNIWQTTKDAYTILYNGAVETYHNFNRYNTAADGYTSGYACGKILSAIPLMGASKAAEIVAAGMNQSMRVIGKSVGYATATQLKTAMNYESVAMRQAKMLQKNAGYNISPESWFATYKTIGVTDTYITDYKAIAGVIGAKRANRQYRVGFFTNKNQISYYKARKLEKALGLKNLSLNAGFRFTRVSKILNHSPRSPLDGNKFFLGNGKGLPGGGPELTIDPLETSPWP